MVVEAEVRREFRLAHSRHPPLTATNFATPSGSSPHVSSKSGESSSQEWSDSATPGLLKKGTIPSRARVAEVLRSSLVMFIENAEQFRECARFQVRRVLDTPT